MKPAAYFVNVARGELVDQAALDRALRERRIAGAAARRLRGGAAAPPTTRCWRSTTSSSPRTGRPRRRRLAGDRAGRWPKGCSAPRAGQVPENVVNPEVLGDRAFLREVVRFRRDREIDILPIPRIYGPGVLQATSSTFSCGKKIQSHLASSRMRPLEKLPHLVDQGQQGFEIDGLGGIVVEIRRLRGVPGHIR